MPNSSLKDQIKNDPKYAQVLSKYVEKLYQDKVKNSDPGFVKRAILRAGALATAKVNLAMKLQRWLFETSYSGQPIEFFHQAENEIRNS